MSLQQMPSTIRRALARRELRRRGLDVEPEEPETGEEWLQRCVPEAVAAFAQMDVLHAKHAHLGDEPWPQEDREESERLMGAAVRAMRLAPDPRGEIDMTPEEEDAWAMEQAHILEARRLKAQRQAAAL